MRLPQPSLRFIPIWRRNLLVWRKLAIPSMLGNLADPMFYMLALGFGLGHLLPKINGIPYITFLAAGTLCYATMNSATFESLYSAFSRMQIQRTWDAILNTPVTLDDIIIGEFTWSITKSMLSGIAILMAILILGIAHNIMLIWLIPLAGLIGACFTGMALVMTALAPNYDFFMYYFSLAITPMTLLCGVFFPSSELPALLQHISALLPLSHAIELARPLVLGKIPSHLFTHVAVLTCYGLIGLCLAINLIEKRFKQ
ncbi:MAG: ABC transporter permease [Proteobacteria bacterium]|nr:ABC transporter permease [Pseudomonadota bacterium]MDE3208622.1 ABC transporter permease [Pseudomonadota bacterium]